MIAALTGVLTHDAVPAVIVLLGSLTVTWHIAMVARNSRSR